MEYFNSGKKILGMGLAAARDKLLSSKPPSIVLDPITTLFRLAILSFSKNSPKLSVCSTSIYVQEGNLSQGIIRNIQGDSKEDLHNLHNPLSLANEWFNIHECSEIKQPLFELASQGINLLIETYRDCSAPGTTHALAHYRSFLECSENGSPIGQRSRSSSVDSEHNSPTSEELQIQQTSNIIYETLKNKIWTKEEINVCYQMLNIALKKKEFSSDYIEAINIILHAKDNKTKNIVETVISGD